MTCLLLSDNYLVLSFSKVNQEMAIIIVLFRVCEILFYGKLTETDAVFFH